MRGFIGEIRMYPYGRVPRGWLPCDGRHLPAGDYSALLHMIGTSYGGDGETEVVLPNLTGRFPVGIGKRPGGAERRLGERGGQEQVVLKAENLPPHSHPVSAATGGPGGRPAVKGGKGFFASTGGSVLVNGVLAAAGTAEAHENLPPFLDLHFCICVHGAFLPREGA